jgi:hypothetical protein
VGQVAYELDLPPEARIHSVSQLKPKLGFAYTALPKLPLVDSNGVLRPEPAEILERRSSPRNNRPFIEILVQWEGQSPDDAMWEEFHGIKDPYPHLVGKVF